jgi:hypothetical protein
MTVCALANEANSRTLTDSFHKQQVPDLLTALSPGLLNCLAVFFLQLPRTEVLEMTPHIGNLLTVAASRLLRNTGKILPVGTWHRHN